MLRLSALACLLLSTLAAPQAHARERLLWLVRDLPPFTIFEGAAKGQGVVDQMLPMLIAQMPEYDHSVVRVNRARGIQMLQEPSFTCDPTLLWTPERAAYVTFSKPLLGVMSSGLVVRKQDKALLAPYLEQHQVDLAPLLAHSQLKLGIVAQRSYSAQVDDILRGLPEQALSRHYGTEATASLLQMQQLGRLQIVLGYWPEIRYLIQQQGGAAEDYDFYPIKGVKQYQFLRVGCSNTDLGRQAIARIDKLLPALRRDTLPGLYARWLEPELQSSYLHQAREFFESSAADAPPVP